MSSYYLCDTCGQPLTFSKKLRVMVCGAEPSTMYRKVISDNQTQREVCPNWKPKEDA